MNNINTSESVIDNTIEANEKISSKIDWSELIVNGGQVYTSGSFLERPVPDPFSVYHIDQNQCNITSKNVNFESKNILVNGTDLNGLIKTVTQFKSEIEHLKSEISYLKDEVRNLK